MTTENIFGYAYPDLAVVVCKQCADTEPEMHPSQFANSSVITFEQAKEMHDWCWECDRDVRYWETDSEKYWETNNEGS